MGEPGVEVALTEIVEQLAEAAKPQLLRGHTASQLRERYRSDFERELKADPGAFARDRLKLTTLAQLVGLLAAFLSRADAVVHGLPAPTEVDERCAYFAGFLVSRTLWPPPGGQELLCRWCRSYPAVGGVYGDLLASSVRPVLRFVMPPITTGPLSR